MEIYRFQIPKGPKISINENVSPEFAEGMLLTFKQRNRRYFRKSDLQIHGDTLNLPNRVTGTVKRWGRTFKIDLPITNYSEYFAHLQPPVTDKHKGFGYAVSIMHDLIRYVGSQSRILRYTGRALLVGLLATPIALLAYGIKKFRKSQAS